jgi:hypothetical protein
MSMTVGPLTLREEKGEPLINPEMDENLRTLRDFCNSLASLFGVALTPDGLFQPGSVTESAIADRAVTLSKLGLVGRFYVDSGAANDYKIAPTPAATEYADGMLFFVRTANANTGPSKLAVNALEAKPIRKRGTVELESGDIPKEGVICVAYYQGVFHLLAGAGGTTTAAIGNLDFWESELAPVPTTGDPEPLVFTHNFGAMPVSKEVYLVCVEEGTHMLGDTVNLSDVVDQDGAAAFTEVWTINDVTITALADQLYVGSTALVASEWNIRASASRVSSGSTLTLPTPVSLAARSPAAAVSYGEYMFVAQGAGSATVALRRTSLRDASVEHVGALAAFSSLKGVQAGLFRLGTTDVAVLMGENKTYKLTLQAKNLLQMFTKGSHRNSPVWVTHSGTDISEVYSVGLFSDNDNNINKVSAMKVWLTTSSAHALYKPSGPPDTFNLRSSSVTGNAEFQNMTTDNSLIVAAQYNHRTGRFYVVDSDSGCLHVFKITSSPVNGAVSFKDWWELTDRYAAMIYEKSLMLGGPPFSGYDVNSQCQLAVEYDLATGAEKAVTWITGGGVARAPWPA